MLQLTAVGHLGQDSVTRTAGDKKAINFSVAHSEKYRDRDGVQQERTTWIDCTIWDREAIAPYLKKGTQVLVQGNPELSLYETNAGGHGAKLKLTVQKVELLGGAKP